MPLQLVKGVNTTADIQPALLTGAVSGVSDGFWASLKATGRSGNTEIEMIPCIVWTPRPIHLFTPAPISS